MLRTTLLTIAASALLFFHLAGISWHDDRYSLDSMINGTAHKPFVYRQLVPTLARLTAPSAGQPIVTGIIVIFFVVYLFAFKWLASAFNVNTMLPAIAGLPLLMANNNHIYDISTLALFTLAYAALAHKRFLLFAALYPLLCLNKETAILITIFFAFQYRLLWLSVYQVITYILIRFFLMWVYSGNAGGVVEFHLFSNAADWILQAQTSIAYAAIILLIAWRIFSKMEQPQFLKTALLTVAPPLAVLFAVFGYSFELRVFYELYPVVALMVI